MTTPKEKSDVATAYDQWAETYDVDLNSTRDLAAEALRQTNLILAGRKVVEIGCGTGRNTEWLIRPAAGLTSIVALDFSEEMLGRARARATDPPSRLCSTMRANHGRWKAIRPIS